ncbi:MAG: HEAT repeat domain-containing protein [Chloroflexia bacterium]|nr:HEAT repeat domain-containing protein [Chloroflexia bacterium]
MARWWPFGKDKQKKSLQLAPDPVDWSLGPEEEREQLLSLLVQELSSPSPSRRERAIELLVQAQATKATSELLDLLQREQHLVVRWKALHALQSLSDLPLDSPDFEVEAWREQAVDGLIEQLGSAKPSQRWGAAEALGQLGDRRAIPALVERLRDPHAFVRWAAAQSLGHIGGEAAIPLLLPMLEEADPLVRRSAIDALAHLDTPTVRKVLHQALHDADPTVLRSAIEAVKQLGDSQATSAVIRALDAENTLWVRYSAAEALGTIGDHRAIPPLIEAARDPEVLIRRVAVRSLGLLRDSRAIPSLVQSLSDPDTQVRLNAADGLGLVGHEGVLAQLGEHLHDNAGVFGRKVGLAVQQAITAIQERTGQEAGR